MTGLRSAVARFAKILRTANGMPFRGTMQPADEGVQSALLPAKLILRTLPGAGIKPRDIVLDDDGQRYLVAKLGTRESYHTFRLFEINADLAWKRVTRGKDPLTGLPRGTTTENLGTIPAMIQRGGADRVDGPSGVAEEVRTIVTSAKIAVGDQIDDGTVQWVVETLGISHGEIR